MIVHPPPPKKPWPVRLFAAIDRGLELAIIVPGCVLVSFVMLMQCNSVVGEPPSPGSVEVTSWAGRYLVRNFGLWLLLVIVVAALARGALHGLAWFTRRPRP